MSDKRRFRVALDFPTRRHLAASNISYPTSVPWEFIALYERTVRRLHGDQTLERMAERGGLSPREIMAVITNSKGWYRETEEVAIVALKQHVAEFEGRSDVELARLRRIEAAALELKAVWDGDGDGIATARLSLREALDALGAVPGSED